MSANAFRTLHVSGTEDATNWWACAEPPQSLDDVPEGGVFDRPDPTDEDIASAPDVKSRPPPICTMDRSLRKAGSSRKVCRVWLC